MHAADLEFASGPGQTHLLELYTSEGCSSCPPAEAWLSQLKGDPRLWREVVPIAFHVDYWDHLGWRDPFASKNWTARQQQYSTAWQSSTVYTPGFVLNGQEWRSRGTLPPSAGGAGVLKISVANGETVAATFAPTAGEVRPLELHVARLGFGLTTNVKAGENSGRKLLHDFVVLSLMSEKMAAGKAQLRSPDPQPSGGREAIVAWVTEADSLTSLQAVGGWVR